MAFRLFRQKHCFEKQAELFRRTVIMNTQQISDVSERLVANTVETVKDYPIVTALIGLGISWFISNKLLKRETASERIINQLQEKVTQLEEEVKGYAESNIPALKESARGAGEVISLKSQSVLKGVSSYVHDKLPHMKESARDTGEAIARKSRSLLKDVSGSINARPLMSSFIGLSAGLILGILTSGILKGNGFSGRL